MKFEKNFYIGMWIQGEIAAKFAVASGLTDSEEEFVNDDLIDWDRWHNKENFKEAGAIFQDLSWAQFYTLEGEYIGRTERTDDTPTVVIRAQNQPEIFQAAYSNKEELFEEFRTMFGKYLPNGFDYEGHIGIYEVFEYDF